jgi:hypothetical protein
MTTATLPRTDQARGPVRAFGLVLVFGIGMTLGLVLPLNRSNAVATTTPVTVAPPAKVVAPAEPMPSLSAAKVDGVATYTTATKNYAAAVAQHDFAMAARFRQQIDAVTTPAVVADVYARYQDLQASIATAGAQHEARLQHAFRAQLSELCAAPGFLAAFPGCQPAISNR